MNKQAQQPLSRLILTGFMGAGKSTVGAILAKDLGWRFIDLDSMIEASCQHTVAEIFRDYGEANFRERERQAVQQLSSEERIVLALGGGAVLRKENAKSALCWPHRSPLQPATTVVCRTTAPRTLP